MKYTQQIINGNSRILKWRYVSTIFLAIFCGDIHLHRPYIGLIYGRYLQFRNLTWPFISDWIKFYVNTICKFSDPEIPIEIITCLLSTSPSACSFEGLQTLLNLGSKHPKYRAVEHSQLIQWSKSYSSIVSHLIYIYIYNVVPPIYKLVYNPHQL